LAGSIPILKKIQNGVVLGKKKTKVNGLQPGFAGSTRSPGQPGHTGSWLMLFFHQPGPVSAPGRPAGPDRVSKHCIYLETPGQGWNRSEKNLAKPAHISDLALFD